MVWLILCFLKFTHNRDWARFVGWCKTLSRTTGIQSVRVTYFLRNQRYRFPTYQHNNWASKCSNCSTRWPCNRTTEPHVGKGHARKSDWDAIQIAHGVISRLISYVLMQLLRLLRDLFLGCLSRWRRLKMFHVFLLPFCLPLFPPSLVPPLSFRPFL